MLEQIADPTELGKVPVEGTGGKLRLTDVADIKVDHQPLIGDAVVNDGDGLLLVVEKFPGANTLEVTKGVEDALEKLQPGLSGLQHRHVRLPAGDLDRGRDRQPDARADHRRRAAGAGPGRLLFEWRTVLVALVTIPVSLVAAALVLDALGETFNAISFAGLAVAIVVVIDEAVVGARTSPRRLRQHREAGATGSRHRAGGLARAAQPARVRDTDRAAGDRADRGHGGPARRLLRAAGAGLRARGRRGDARRADRHPALALLLFSRGRPAASRRCCGASRRATTALSTVLAPAARGAHRRRRLRRRPAWPCCRCSARRRSLVQGPGRARPLDASPAPPTRG